jgi:hypothetical protein
VRAFVFLVVVTLYLSVCLGLCVQLLRTRMKSERKGGGMDSG